MSIGKYRSRAFSKYGRQREPIARESFMTFLKSVASKFSEKKITVSTRHKHFFISIPWYVQLFFIFSLFIFLFWFSIFTLSLRIEKRKIDQTQREMLSLKEANRKLIAHIEKVNDDLEEFNSIIADRIRKKPENGPDNAAGVKKLTRQKKYREAAEAAINGNSMLIGALMDHLNMYLSYVTQTINSLGLNYEDFIDRHPEFKKVSVSKNIINILNSRVPPEERYPRYKKYYFFVSSVADEFFRTTTEKFSKSVIKGKYEILARLESVLQSLPTDAPFLSSFKVTSGFGYRTDPFSKSTTRKHKGIDLKSETNATIVSSGAGVVAFAGKKGGYGNIVELHHGNGIKTRYAHLKDINVSTGQVVSSRQKLGSQGATGSRCKGEHLHYELLFRDKQINPIRFIYAKRNHKDGDLQQI